VDLTTLIGSVIGVGCIALGHSLADELPAALSAALIVIGGTLGAVIAQFPPRELRLAVRQLALVFRPSKSDAERLIAQLVALARVSRKEGLLALEKEAGRIADPFLRQALLALVDGHETPVLRTQLASAIEQNESRREPGPRFFEAAGGYAPTIGILGAVLGLIQTMQRLGDPSQLGSGIAVAFVATVYGVGSANLVFLPLAGKLKLKIRAESRRRELIAEGVCAIADGTNPGQIEKRLQSWLDEVPDAEKGGRARAPQRARA
jgi:chemotaxis protein MotA